MATITPVYCDKVQATANPSTFAETAIAMSDLVESLGGRTENNTETYRQVYMPNGGLILCTVKNKVSIFTINGKACAELRLMKKFNQALQVIGSYPHRVTNIHAKVDLFTNSTAKQLRKLGKLIKTQDVWGYPEIDIQQFPNLRPDGERPNNLVFPKYKKPTEVRRVYYDKSLESYESLLKNNKDAEYVPEEKLSVELRVTNRATRKGLSLRDASEPEPLYWHYQTDCPLVGKHKPKKVADWETFGSEFESSIIRRTPDQKLTDLLTYGGDIHTIARLSVQLGRVEEANRFWQHLIAEAQRKA